MLDPTTRLPVTLDKPLTLSMVVLNEPDVASPVTLVVDAFIKLVVRVPPATMLVAALMSPAMSRV